MLDNYRDSTASSSSHNIKQWPKTSPSAAPLGAGVGAFDDDNHPLLGVAGINRASSRPLTSETGGVPSKSQITAAQLVDGLLRRAASRFSRTAPAAFSESAPMEPRCEGKAGPSRCMRKGKTSVEEMVSAVLGRAATVVGRSGSGRAMVGQRHLHSSASIVSGVLSSPGVSPARDLKSDFSAAVNGAGALPAEGRPLSSKVSTPLREPSSGSALQTSLSPPWPASLASSSESAPTVEVRSPGGTVITRHSGATVACERRQDDTTSLADTVSGFANTQEMLQHALMPSEHEDPVALPRELETTINEASMIDNSSANRLEDGIAPKEEFHLMGSPRSRSPQQKRRHSGTSPTLSGRGLLAIAREVASEDAAGGLAMPPNVGESGSLALFRGDASPDAASPGSSDELEQLHASCETLKSKIREKDQQKQKLYRDLMEARELAWEHKREAEHARHQLKEVLAASGAMEAAFDEFQDVSAFGTLSLSESGASYLSPPRSSPSSSRGGTDRVHPALQRKASMSELLKRKEDQLNQACTALSEARAMASMYHRSSEQRLEVIRLFESQEASHAVLAGTACHPAGDIFLGAIESMIRPMGHATSEDTYEMLEAALAPPEGDEIDFQSAEQNFQSETASQEPSADDEPPLAPSLVALPFSASLQKGTSHRLGRGAPHTLQPVREAKFEQQLEEAELELGQLDDPQRSPSEHKRKHEDSSSQSDVDIDKRQRLCDAECQVAFSPRIAAQAQSCFSGTQRDAGCQASSSQNIVSEPRRPPAHSLGAPRTPALQAGCSAAGYTSQAGCGAPLNPSGTRLTSELGAVRPAAAGGSDYQNLDALAAAAIERAMPTAITQLESRLEETRMRLKMSLVEAVKARPNLSAIAPVPTVQTFHRSGEVEPGSAAAPVSTAQTFHSSGEVEPGVIAVDNPELHRFEASSDGIIHARGQASASADRVLGREQKDARQEACELLCSSLGRRLDPPTQLQKAQAMEMLKGIMGYHYALLCVQAKAKTFLARALLADLRSPGSAASSSIPHTVSPVSGHRTRPQSAVSRTGSRPHSAASAGGNSAAFYSGVHQLRHRPTSASLSSMASELGGEALTPGTTGSRGLHGVPLSRPVSAISRPTSASTMGNFTARPRWSESVKPANVPPLPLQLVKFGEPIDSTMYECPLEDDEGGTMPEVGESDAIAGNVMTGMMVLPEASESDTTGGDVSASTELMANEVLQSTPLGQPAITQQPRWQQRPGAHSAPRQKKHQPQSRVQRPKSSQAACGSAMAAVRSAAASAAAQPEAEPQALSDMISTAPSGIGANMRPSSSPMVRGAQAASRLQPRRTQSAGSIRKHGGRQSRPQGSPSRRKVSPAGRPEDISQATLLLIKTRAASSEQWPPMSREARGLRPKSQTVHWWAHKSMTVKRLPGLRAGHRLDQAQTLPDLESAMAMVEQQHEAEWATLEEQAFESMEEGF
eukprot:TRINITY_DN15035_c0_g1_i1.p1 TRINITY_DN15035_c0_g1~~TRINITY_DN15035_c0_g1_i1.p1  ORF type:complete len:1455 (-),score=276.29 TRINITY_DN15035_c0_g1_i1:150-4514(-)